MFLFFVDFRFNKGWTFSPKKSIFALKMASSWSNYPLENSTYGLSLSSSNSNNSSLEEVLPLSCMQRQRQMLRMNNIVSSYHTWNNHVSNYMSSVVLKRIITNCGMHTLLWIVHIDFDFLCTHFGWVGSYFSATATLLKIMTYTSSKREIVIVSLSYHQSKS